MEKTVTVEPTAAEITELQSEIQRLLMEMGRADDRIKRYQEETDKLRAETRAMLASLKAR